MPIKRYILIIPAILIFLCLVGVIVYSYRLLILDTFLGQIVYSTHDNVTYTTENGRHRVPLAIGSNPDISSDGQQIIYVTSQSVPYGNVMVIQSDGISATPLAVSCECAEPQWSSDDSRIAFTAYSTGVAGTHFIITDSRGDILQSIQPFGAPADIRWPTWSPDGSQIAFAASEFGASSRLDFEIYKMNVDGSNLRRLTRNNNEDMYPAWSPDGQHIAFTTDRDGNYEIYLMNTDGSGLSRLTNHPSMDTLPTWSPDGIQIAFLSTRIGGEIQAMENFWLDRQGIYVMNSDGSDTRYFAASRGQSIMDFAWGVSSDK